MTPIKQHLAIAQPWEDVIKMFECHDVQKYKEKRKVHRKRRYKLHIDVPLYFYKLCSFSHLEIQEKITVNHEKQYMHIVGTNKNAQNMIQMKETVLYRIHPKNPLWYVFFCRIKKNKVVEFSLSTTPMMGIEDVVGRAVMEKKNYLQTKDACLNIGNENDQEGISSHSSNVRAS
eukprot:gb/GECH01009105.1/.p1 GENE.gb/GECH01009105.1/~~gb/GECH01009105.1/.p1  ORF type:complete len:174 (+),score=39.61 gb/GECH01009105.1/:1-522(+)